MNAALYFHKDVFYKRYKNWVLLYNVFDYSNRLKMDLFAADILELVDGSRGKNDILVNMQLHNAEIYEKYNLASVIDYLIEHNFLTFSSSIGKIPKTRQKGPTLDLVNLRLTNACNFRCVHCFPDSSRGYEEGYSAAQIKELIDKLEEYKVLHITFTGGEPFLKPYLIDMIKYANKKGMLVSICTNASLIKEEHISALKTCAIGSIKVSMDGATEHTHSLYRGGNKFDALIEKIRILVDAGLPICINTVFSQLNKKEYREIGNLVKQLGVREFAYNFIVKSGRAAKAWDNLGLDIREKTEILTYYNSFKGQLGQVVVGSKLFPAILQDTLEEDALDKVCGLCLSNIVILADGEVVPCWRLHDLGLSAGNIMKDEFDEVWSNSELFQRIRALKVSSIDKCKECRNNFLCDASCRGLAMQSHGDWYGPPPEPECGLQQLNYG